MVDYTQSRIDHKKLVVVLICAITATLAIARSSSETLLSQPLTVRWRYESNVTLNLTPAFDKERVYLPELLIFNCVFLRIMSE